jgi:osmotically inducible lipoprotein OsmB
VENGFRIIRTPKQKTRAPLRDRNHSVARALMSYALLTRNPPVRLAPDKGLSKMHKLVIALAAAGALAAVSAPALAGPVSGAVIGAGSGAVIAGPPGAVVGGVVGAVVGGPDIHYYHHHRVYIDGERHYYMSHHHRVYY